MLCAPEWISVPAAAAAPRFPASTALIGRFGAAASKAFPEAGGNPVLRSLAVNCLNRPTKIVSVSSAISEDLGECFGVDAERIAVMRNMVDVAKCQELGSEPVEETRL